MSQLPPPSRTAPQAIREIMLIAIRDMPEDQMQSVYSHIGPLCLNAVLDLVTKEPVPDPVKTTPQTIPVNEARELRDEFREVLTAAGSFDRLSIVSLGIHPKSADGLMGDSKQYKLAAHTADQVRAIIDSFEKESSDDE